MVETSIRFVKLVVLVMVVATSGVGDVAAELPELNDQNYAAWRNHILPKQAELGWHQIPWLTTFKDGILAANDAGKPLLFWTMNGHPLGCT